MIPYDFRWFFHNHLISKRQREGRTPARPLEHQLNHLRQVFRENRNFGSRDDAAVTLEHAPPIMRSRGSMTLPNHTVTRERDPPRLCGHAGACPSQITRSRGSAPLPSRLMPHVYRQKIRSQRDIKTGIISCGRAKTQPSRIIQMTYLLKNGILEITKTAQKLKTKVNMDIIGTENSGWMKKGGMPIHFKWSSMKTWIK